LTVTKLCAPSARAFAENLAKGSAGLYAQVAVNSAIEELGQLLMSVLVCQSYSSADTPPP
jgi:hypothetical protein